MPLLSPSITRQGGRLLLLMISLLLLGGCLVGTQTTKRPMAEIGPDDGYAARLSLFLHLNKSEGPGVRLEVAAFEIYGAGEWLPIAAGPLEIDSKQIGPTQLFLGDRSVPTGQYQRLRFRVNKGLVLRENGQYEEIAASPFTVDLGLPASFSLESSDSRSLFFIWDVEQTVENKTLRPVMIIVPQMRQLLTNLTYVSCPETNTIYEVRNDRNWVTASFGIKGRPTYLAIDPDPARRRLYVLASRESTIKVVDLLSQRVVNFFRLPLSGLLTFMTISPDGNWAYVLEERLSYLSRIDLNTGRIAARVRLGHRPQYVSYLAEQNLLAVSGGLTQSVSLLHPVDLSLVRTILTGNSPQGLLAANNLLYIAESGDNTIAIFDLESNSSQSRLDIGAAPYRLLDTGNNIYVSNYEDGSLSILLPRQLGIVNEVHGLGRPREMAYDNTHRRVYVAEEETGELAIIDSTSNQFVGRITLGARPFGLAVIQ